jgi:Domain of unknown function (DUF4157)
MDPGASGPRGDRLARGRRAPTLGDRLALTARRVAERTSAASAWAETARPLFERVSALPAGGRRFRRVEPFGDAPDRDRRDPDEKQLGGHGGIALEPMLRERLRELVGPGLHALRLHVDSRADAIARAHRADAIAIGPDVHFREGRFRPHEDRGFALLAHEASHVARWTRPGASFDRATPGGVAREEREAARLEARALTSRRGSAPPVARAGLAAPAQPSAAAPSTTALRPMTAAGDRADQPDMAAALTGPDIDALKQTLYRDLMRDIRTEFERGG